MNIKNSWTKIVIGYLGVFAFRLIPFRPMNVEPVLGMMMPISKKFGYLFSFLFGFLSISLFDIAVGKVGGWTLLTGVTYGLVGLASAWYFKGRTANAVNFVTFGIIGTLIYDAITGLAFGPIFFGQSFLSAAIGQIPFTLNHLAGSVLFSLVLSPAMNRWILESKRLEDSYVFAKFAKVS